MSDTLEGLDNNGEHAHSDGHAHRLRSFKENSSSKSPSPEYVPPTPMSIPSKSHHALVIISAIVIMFVLVGVSVYFVLNSPTHIATQKTTTATVNTTIPRSNQTFNPYILTTSSYALYGIPNSSDFNMYLNTINSNVLGAPVTPIAVYGLNVTSFIETPTVDHLNYSPTIPRKYANVSYPIAVVVRVFNFSNSSTANSMFQSFMYHKISESGQNPTMNYSVPVFISENHSYYFNVSKYENSTLYHTILTFNYTSFNGTPVKLESIKPIYTKLVQDQLAFRNGRYVVMVLTFGIDGKLNTTYQMNILRHMVNSMRSV